MRFGVCYYPEHWPEARWQVDARMMRDAGLDLVRIAEFAWAKMEPVEGQYEWDWLDRAIGVLADAGLDIVLGTPTAAPPVWMSRQYPDILRQDANGRFRDHGTRRQYCPNSPRYIEHSQRVTAVMGERYGQDERIIGWQIDNEFGGGKTARCYCENCAAGFRRWLTERYGTIDALNEGWGNIFWSQSYQTWEQIRPPDDQIDKPNSSHVLDYYRFCSDSFVTYQQHQIDILKTLAPEHFITTNFMGLYADLDQFDLAAPYDFITWDSYPTGNLDRWQGVLEPPMHLSDTQDNAYAYDVGDPLVTGMAHELTRALKQLPFWIMEQQAGYINWGNNNPAPRDGTVRLWCWQALAADAEAVVFFRWRATLFAQEQYHSGLLRHDGQPAIGYQELLKMQGERELMSQISAARLEAQVALLLSYDDLWSLELQPHSDGFSYLALHYSYYKALNLAGIPVHFVHETQDLGKYRLVIIPTAHLVDETLAEKLKEYVNGGGNIILGVRSGFKTISNLVTDKVLPGLLHPLVGATVESWRALPQGVGIDFHAAVPDLSGSVTNWVEALKCETAVSIAETTEGEIVATQNNFGAGMVYYLGFYPQLKHVRPLIAHVTGQISIEPVANFPMGIVAYKKGNFTILLNFTDEILQVEVGSETIPVPGRDVRIHHHPG